MYQPKNIGLLLLEWQGLVRLLIGHERSYPIQKFAYGTVDTAQMGSHECPNRTFLLPSN